VIVDTTFVIDLIRNDPQAACKARDLVKSGEPQSLSAITMFELLSGAVRSNKKNQEKEKIIAALKLQLVIPITDAMAQRAGEIHGALIKKGQPIDSHDCLIAGTALIKKEKVLTRNVKHFSRIEGLSVETY
jgi:tRNA(fMet)-specific endonuclease VapC